MLHGRAARKYAFLFATRNHKEPQGKAVRMERFFAPGWARSDTSSWRLSELGISAEVCEAGQQKVKERRCKAVETRGEGTVAGGGRRGGTSAGGGVRLMLCQREAHVVAVLCSKKGAVEAAAVPSVPPPKRGSKHGGGEWQPAGTDPCPSGRGGREDERTSGRGGREDGWTRRTRGRGDEEDGDEERTRDSDG